MTSAPGVARVGAVNRTHVDRTRTPTKGRLALLLMVLVAAVAALVTLQGGGHASADPVPCPRDVSCGPAASPTGPPAVTAGRVEGSVDHGGSSVGPNGEPLGDLTLLLSWAMWLGDVVCLVAFVIAAGRIGSAIHNGEAISGVRGAAMTCMAALVIGGSLTLAHTILS